MRKAEKKQLPATEMRGWDEYWLYHLIQESWGGRTLLRRPLRPNPYERTSGWQKTSWRAVGENVQWEPAYRYRLARLPRSAPSVVIPKRLLDRVVLECWHAHPEKCFGVLHGPAGGAPEAHYTFEKNARAEHQEYFEQLAESTGDDFYKSPEAGFAADPKEQLALMKMLDAKEHEILAIFHSHRFHKANFSPADAQLSYPGAYSLLVSLEEPRQPVVRAFRVEDGKPVELRVKPDHSFFHKQAATRALAKMRGAAATAMAALKRYSTTTRRKPGSPP